MSKFSRRRNSKKRKSVRNRKLRGGVETCPICHSANTTCANINNNNNNNTSIVCWCYNCHYSYKYR